MAPIVTKRSSVSTDMKVIILENVNKHHIAKCEITKMFNMTKNTLLTIIKNWDSIIKQRMPSRFYKTFLEGKKILNPNDCFQMINGPASGIPEFCNGHLKQKSITSFFQKLTSTSHF